ncbi:DUF5791 family protein [Haloarculaceae archaeon H-GB2-1]|nr:DUF5791 family protein [Haloarculaceae archaeon H-GB1-1]MEA5387706.1 DUF5791 family protein [Haloarculaceae archaeon H-GB11]MEA5409198.1 DUF5791 family protein [Haloarculaceae archaeon H-GB2-1]
MLRGEFDDAAESTPEELRESYESVLAEVVESVGIETVVDETGLGRERVSALLEGESPELTVSEAAGILALADEWPDAEAIQFEAQDILLMGMTSAVLDVDSLASKLDGDTDAKTIQAMIEGRHPMTLEQYAKIHHLVTTDR